MNTICIARACLFAWWALAGLGHTEYQVAPAPAAAVSAQPSPDPTSPLGPCCRTPGRTALCSTQAQ